MKHIKDLVEEHFGYYTFPFSGEGFNGNVIELDGDSCRVYFNTEGSGDEAKFRAKLERIDEWFTTKPYKVQKRWQELTMNWLAKPKKEADDD